MSASDTAAGSTRDHARFRDSDLVGTLVSRTGTNGGATVDRERGAEQHRNEEVEAADGEGQQSEQTSGDEQSIPEEPDIEVERQASGDPSRADRD
jgi:hypothetical protein